MSFRSQANEAECYANEAQFEVVDATADAAPPSLVALTCWLVAWHATDTFYAVHQHGAKERGRRACPVTCTGSTVELPSEPDSGSVGSSSRVTSASGHHGASTGLAAFLESFNISR